MSNYFGLRDWMEENSHELCSFGYSLSYRKELQGQESLDIDSRFLVGRITCWGQDCEMQFNAVGDGSVVLLISGLRIDDDGLIELMRSHKLLG